MAVVRLEAMKTLAAALLAAVPGLEIVVGAPGASQKACFPSLAIHPVRFQFFANEETPYYEPPAQNKLVVHLGTHEATVQLRLLTATPGDRYAVEEKILDVFMATEGHPGVLLTPVHALDAQFGSFLVAWELDEEEWVDEKAFDSVLGSVMTVTAIVPALATRDGVYTQEHLLLAFTEDMKRVFTTDTLLRPTVEVVEINQDGSIS